MKALSIRIKITLWFSVMLISINLIAMVVMIYISSYVLKKDIQDKLILTVEDNFDEIEYFEYIKDAYPDGDGDDYIEYQGGYLEIDDDFLDLVNGNYTALYRDNGLLVYGENPVSEQTISLSFEQSRVRTVVGILGEYYVYDKKLELKGLEGLWLRGVVSSQSGVSKINSIIQLALFLSPILVFLAILGGYVIAGRILRPIKDIAKAAEVISGGKDLKKRIDIGEGKDELHQLGDVVNGMIQRLDNSFESEKRFSSDVSHELRTPVTVISAQCEHILKKSRSENEYVHAIQVIGRQSGKMDRMISQMLEFTRLERNMEQYEKKDIDFSDLVCLAGNDFQYVKEKNISLQMRLDHKIVVFGNYELLLRLVNNLISNAYRYGVENGWVKILLQRQGNKAVLSVEDNGIGIDDRDIDKIFDRFYRGDESRNSEGTGLGLAIAKEIVEFHTGDITVESVSGQGSKFQVELSLSCN